MRRWIEGGQAPNEVVASRVEHGAIVRTRPLCPYPQSAAYTGVGSTNDAKNFVCR
jgi:feruloyl esterase